MTQAEARKLIKQHLKEKGREPINVTIDVVEYWWDILNIAVFVEELPRPVKVKVKTLTTSWAWTKSSGLPNRVNLVICDKFETYRLFLAILVHEMVHSYEYLKYEDMSHGETFTKWKGRIKRTTNLPLKTKYK